ncbi:hypothetical protein COLO4_13457 [Corchorus olitorius]|uniref:Kinesin motor domain-containing protein n=1 Tax=Corchorus olitorius TaxID=93759 RepID=A0A1R3JWF2_9ROSI|nr:hypothetical protein COLO4_13457 [Corchorus olitorius]
MDEDTISSMNQEISPAQGPTPPILQKVGNLSNSVQKLKKEHEILSNQVKGISTDSVLGHDVLGTPQLLNNEDELLKKKCLDESSERKCLYNEVIKLKGNIRVSADSTDEVLGLLKSGSQVRSVGATNANELSSRSHCLLRVTVRGTDLESGEETRNHLWMVDLAGSERVGKIEVEGERLKESQFIKWPLPGRFLHLPTELKRKIVEPMSYVDISRMAGACRSLRTLVDQWESRKKITNPSSCKEPHAIVETSPGSSTPTDHHTDPQEFAATCKHQPSEKCPHRTSVPRSSASAQMGGAGNDPEEATLYP